jgi:uroporphyrinogen-III synthase
VTRPTGQAEGLCRLITEAGGRAIPFPTTLIQAVPDPGPAAALLAEDWDLVVFTSRNAVEHGLPLCPAGRPKAAALAAVGEATARALDAAGCPPDLVPTGRYDSEALLALDALTAVLGQRVLIARGEGGRATLGNTLAERGARVAYAEVYRRTPPAVDPGSLLAQWTAEIQLVTATSDEILRNLTEILGPSGHAALVATPLVVVSARTAALAEAVGFRRVEVADRAGDAEILAALCRAAQPISGPAADSP